MNKKFERKKIATLVGTCLLLSSTVASFAWACTPQNLISHVGPKRAPEGSIVSVSGQAESFAGQPVDIRWNNPQGQPVASTLVGQNGSFSTTMTVPQAPAGVYYLVLVGKDGSGMARAAFQLTASSPSDSFSSSTRSQAESGQASSVDLWSGFSRASGAIESASPEPAQALQTSPPGLIGAGLMLVGAMALAGGLTAASARRRGKSTRQSA